MRAGLFGLLLGCLPGLVLAVGEVPEAKPSKEPDVLGGAALSMNKEMSEEEKQRALCFDAKKREELARVQAAKEKNASTMDGAKQELQNPTKPKADDELKKECEQVKLEEGVAEAANDKPKTEPAADKPSVDLPKAELADKPAAPGTPAPAQDVPQADLPGLEQQNLPGREEGQNLGEMLRQALQQKAQNDQQADNEERYPSTDREVRDRCAQAGYPSETLLRQLAQWDARNDKAMDPCFVNDEAYVKAYTAAKQPKPTTPDGNVGVAPEDLVNGVNASNAAVLRLCNAGVLEAVKGLDLQGVAPEVGFKKETELTLSEKNLLAAKPAVATELQQTMQRFQAGVRNALTNVTLPVSDTLVKDQAYQQGQLCAPKLKAGQ